MKRGLGQKKPHIRRVLGEWRASFSNFNVVGMTPYKAFDRLRFFVLQATSGRIKL
jgi:hypothetical protein